MNVKLVSKNNENVIVGEGTPYTPAQENVTVGFCDDACFAGNGLPLAQWMHPVRAEVAGCYVKDRRLIVSARLGSNACWQSGVTIPDVGFSQCDLWSWNCPSWTVPALLAAECVLDCNI